MTPQDERSLGELAEEDPDAFLKSVRTTFGQEDFGRQELVELASNLAAQEETNLFRVIQEHPEKVEEIWGKPIEIPDELVVRLDDALETVRNEF